jgi:alkylation response protein AidB-like acyl-CoA dehydrogenase
MPFFQAPPALGNQFTQDRVLRTFLTRKVAPGILAEILPSLEELGELSGGILQERSVVERLDEPRVTQWDAWGKRVDTIQLTPLWRDIAKLAAEKGLIATAYERRHGAASRIHQFALNYVIEPATHVYSCPLAMTDGAARTLLATKNQGLIDRAIPRLTSRNPEVAWTSGQWMTERTGGSDVAITETVAKKDASGDGSLYRLYGTKWFTSATTSQMSLTLARPEGNPPGGSGLALFYVEMRNAGGLLEGIQINRLKDKLGTRMVPTAELTLDGLLAHPVVGLKDGIKNITPMLSVTRTWNALGAVSGMRRGLALARDYAKKRVAFGAPLVDKPLHADTLAVMHAEFEGAFLFAFRAIELLGKDESGELSERDAQLLRLVTPLVKLTTAKQAVAVASEVLEAFGGAGYVEDTGLPRLLRDAQVLPIWEGTTNVLSLDVLRALARSPAPLEALVAEVAACRAQASTAALRDAGDKAVRAVGHACAWLMEAKERGLDAVEGGARRFAMTLGRAFELALLVEHASWALANAGDPRPAASARFFARTPIDLILEDDTLADAKLLASYDD